MGVIPRVRRSVLFVLILLSAPTLSGCSSTFQSGPQRLYSNDEEKTSTRTTLAWLKTNYLSTGDDEGLRREYRDEYIGESMKYTNRQYYDYETRLTQDRQRIGFGLGVTSIGLSTAGSLSPAGDTARILSGVAGAVTGVKGQYESEVLFAKTLQIIQAQMRANRDTVAAHIFTGMKLSTRDYPLSMAEADLEDFYGSGTLTAGLLKTAASVAQGAAAAESEKKLVVEGKYAPDDSSDTIRKYIFVNGVWNEARYEELQGILASLDRSVELFQILDHPEYAMPRNNLIKTARSRGIAL